MKPSSYWKTTFAAVAAAVAATLCAEDIASLQARIDATAAAGGGKVEIAPGEHLLEGPIRLRSNIELHLADDAKLVFSDNPDCYLPPVLSSWEGVECMMLSPLVYAFGCTNVAITGGGTFAPKMKFWRGWFGRGAGHRAATRQLYDWCSFQDVPPEKRDVTRIPESNVRPHLMQFNRCKNVKLDGFRIRESPFWTIHLLQSEDCTLRNLDVYAHGHNNDGVDVEMTRNVLIENCSFDQGDDAIVIKSGRNRDAWRIGLPSENIEIRNCKVANGHVLLGVGSEMSGGVRNVYMHDCELTSNCFNLFYLKTNERRGGFIKNIRMENVKAKGVRDAVLGIATDVVYQWKDFPTHEVRVTDIDGIYMKNVEVESADWLVRIRGDRRNPVENVVLDNVRCARTKKPDVVENARNVTVNGVPPPDLTARRIAELFLSADPTMYGPVGYGGHKKYGGGEIVHYATASLWVSAMECAAALGDTNLLDRLTAAFEPFYAARAKAMNDLRHVDLAIVGAVPLEIAILTGDRRAAALGLGYADRQWEAPHEGIDWGDRWYDPIPLADRKKWFEQGYTPQTRLWIDDMYMITLLQSQAYRLSGKRDYIERAAREMCLYLERLQRPDGLFNHGPDVPFVWGRGDGWMAAGMALNLKYLPEDSEWRAPILDGFAKMASTLLKYQRSSGLWGQLVDDNGSWDETSGSAMFAYAFAEGAKAGILGEEYLAAARKAYAALVARIDACGNLGGVCVGTGKKASRDWYLSRPVCNGDPHGQAPMLWLCRALLADKK